MASTLKRILVGKPISSDQADHQRLSNAIALPVFSSDAISSTAYATEEILFVQCVCQAISVFGRRVTSDVDLVVSKFNQLSMICKKGTRSNAFRDKYNSQKHRNHGDKAEEPDTCTLPCGGDPSARHRLMAITAAPPIGVPKNVAATTPDNGCNGPTDGASSVIGVSDTLNESRSSGAA